jgi:hypothetical protein
MVAGGRNSSRRIFRSDAKGAAREVYVVNRRVELHSSLLISNLGSLSDLLRRRAQVDVVAAVLTQCSNPKNSPNNENDIALRKVRARVVWDVGMKKG